MRRPIAQVIEREAMIVAVPIEMKPEANTMARIVFKRAFNAAPMVYYSVVCADSHFGLAHYLRSVSATEFVLCIENTTPEARVVTVMYDAMRIE